jgi:DNA polymerase I
MIEAPLERIESDVALVREIMRRASRIVLNTDLAGTHELRTDVVIVRHPDRYVDKRGTKIWGNVMNQLAAVDSERRKIA